MRMNFNFSQNAAGWVSVILPTLVFLIWDYVSNTTKTWFHMTSVTGRSWDQLEPLTPKASVT